MSMPRRFLDIKEELGIVRDVLMILQHRRLTYFAHVVRMGPERFPNILLYGHINGTRPRGRPRKRWIDNVREDCESLGLSLAERDRLANNRRNWNLVVSRAASARQPGGCWFLFCEYYKKIKTCAHKDMVGVWGGGGEGWECCGIVGRMGVEG